MVSEPASTVAVASITVTPAGSSSTIVNVVAVTSKPATVAVNTRVLSASSKSSSWMVTSTVAVVSATPIVNAGGSVYASAAAVVVGPAVKVTTTSVVAGESSVAVTCTVPTSSLTEPPAASVVSVRVVGSVNGVVMPCTAIFQLVSPVIQVPVGVSARSMRWASSRMLQPAAAPASSASSCRRVARGISRALMALVVSATYITKK